MWICKAAPVLKFVGTVSLGLLTGVSYTVSNVALPSLLRLPSSSSAAHAVSSIVESLETPLLTLSSFAAVPFFLSFIGSPRSLRHPYLLYTSILTVLSVGVPRLLAPQIPRAAAAATTKKQPAASRPRMDASYEVLGDVHSEPASEEELGDDLVNGEEVRVNVQSLTKAFMARGAFAAAGFVMAVVGIWGDGVPRTSVIVS